MSLTGAPTHAPIGPYGPSIEYYKLSAHQGFNQSPAAPVLDATEVRTRLIQQSCISTAPRKHVASLVIGMGKSLNGLWPCDIGDDAEMREYGGKRPHCVRGKFFGNGIIDCSSCRLTAPTSIRSSRLLPSSKPCFETPLSEPSRQPVSASAFC